MIEQKKEHILVCLSSAPSNVKIIETASKMAEAFCANFTALYVETPANELILDEDKKRLNKNIDFARQLGATISTVYGDDIAQQIAEFSRLSGVTKVVMGRSIVIKKRLFHKPTLTEQLTLLSPNLEIHIIPDAKIKQTEQKKNFINKETLLHTIKDIGISSAILLVSTALGFLFDSVGFTDANIITIYILGVLITSILTNSRICWVISSTVGVLLFNLFFTEPTFSFVAYDDGYPVTFLIMLIASLVTGSLATKLKQSARQSAKAAYRTNILLDTNQMLSSTNNSKDILMVAKKQVEKLLGQNVTVFSKKHVSPTTDDENALNMAFAICSQTGYGTNTFQNAQNAYYPIHINKDIYGVIAIDAKKHIGAFTSSILLSILGECAMALENDKNAKEKEEAAILAEQEQLRANLLRTISHDLRTPLTSISGNADNLLANDAIFDEETRKQIYLDIYEDSKWLTGLVENLLSITRIEEGKTQLHLSDELVSDVIEEALRHIGRCERGHIITVDDGNDIVFAMMDARLIVQVIINLVDNAIKHTPNESHIKISVKVETDLVKISVSDDGNGIPDDIKPRVFDMFYTGANQIADSRRSLGLGLSLCRSILKAHGREITISDNKPHGAVFTFTLQKGSVKIHE